VEKRVTVQNQPARASLNARVNAYYAQRQYDAALPLAEEALRLNEQELGPDHLEVATSLNNLALLHQNKGNYERALRLYQRALAIMEKTLGEHHPDVATSLNNLATLYHLEGDYERALRLYQRALAITEQALGKRHSGVALPLDNLALLYADKGDYERALRLHERALAIREQALGEAHPDVATSLNNLAVLYAYKGDYERALPLYERALAIEEKALGERHPSLAKTVNNLAALYHLKGDYERALRLHERALAIVEQALGEHHPDVALSLNNLAALHWERGQGEEAMAYLQRSMDAREVHIGLVSAGDSVRARRLLLTQYSEEMDVVISFALQYPQSQSRYLALKTLLSRKGRVLDSMSDAFAALRRHSSRDARKLLDEYRANRAIYARRLLQGPERIPADRHRKDLEALAQRGHELERLIAERSKAFRDYRRPVTPETVQTALPQDAMLVEWMRYSAVDPRAPPGQKFGAERYAAAILGKTGEPVWLDLGEARPIDTAIATWRAALSRRLANAGAAARALDALVMAPVRAHLGNATHVFLAPDAALNLVPFAALVDEQGRYLVERYLFTYLTSGRDLVRLAGRDDARPRSAPLIVANPQYDVPGRPAKHDFRPLRHTMAEARAVQALVPGATLLTGALATESALKRAGGPAILHLATHGYFSATTCGESDAAVDDASLQSGLALAGANACRSPGTGKKGDDDGLLTALETAALDLYGTELVVLSACDTGVGATEIRDEFLARNIGRGDGVQGLRRALTLAGARTQMVTLWPVGDATTRQLVTAYYGKLAQGMGRSQALRKVQLELLRAADTAHPNDWASFIVSGNDAPLDVPMTTR
jgi:CHAT domain-containing protein/Tfp pilus assembly protein PilF